MMSGSLFEADVPGGFLYRSDFITADEEQGLADHIAAIAFSNFEMRGVVLGDASRSSAEATTRATSRRRQYRSSCCRCEIGSPTGRT
jgi:hypothetical protein